MTRGGRSGGLLIHSTQPSVVLIAKGRLTEPHNQCQKSTSQTSLAPGRHHPGIPGAIKSVQVGDFVGIRIHGTGRAGQLQPQHRPLRLPDAPVPIPVQQGQGVIGGGRLHGIFRDSAG